MGLGDFECDTWRFAMHFDEESMLSNPSFNHASTRVHSPDIQQTEGIANPLLTRGEAAAATGMKAQTLATWASLGRHNLPYVKIGRSVRYRRADIDAFIASRTVGGTANPGVTA